MPRCHRNFRVKRTLKHRASIILKQRASSILKQRANMSEMAHKNAAGPIPDGWELKKDGRSKKMCYWCPATGQHFFTYEDLMRYVNYAKEAKLSIYAPDFKSSKLKRKPRKNKPSFAARKNLGQSSRQPFNEGKESTDPVESTEPVDSTDPMEISDPVESTDTGKNSEAVQAGLAAEPDIDREVFEVDSKKE